MTKRMAGSTKGRLSLILVIFSLLLTACKIPAPATEQVPKVAPQVLFTAAAQTAQARQTGALVGLSTPTPTLSPSTQMPLPTPTSPVVAAVILPTGDPAATGDKAEFVQDVNVPDGTAFKPNEPFIKTWRLRNSGASAWTPDYALVFASGELMGGAPAMPMPREVLPGETVDLSVNLLAPPVPSAETYQGFWKLRNANGQVFGVGASGQDAFWVTITVSGPLAASTGTPVTGGSIVTTAMLALETPDFSGACPHIFAFTAELTLSQPATITYVMEAGSQDSGELKLPPPATSNLDAGTHMVRYELAFAQDIDGWARLHVTAPESVYSNQVNFSLTCE
jgi:hypothetical protein